MCGFIGCINNKPVAISADDKAVFEKMNKFIEHRGPDDEGYFYEDHISMGFRRLSIVDVENGHQPLAYDDGRYWIIFNGEVYNHVALREELIAKGHTFKTESDTEVIIAMYSEYKEESVKRLRGMFGFVIWDREEKTAFIARDQIGIKPVNYVEVDDKLYVGSEKKSLLLAMNKQAIDDESLQHYMTYQFVPEPASIIKEIHSLEPGHYMVKKIGQPVEITAYWKPTFEPVQKAETEYVKELREALMDSVKMHMRSDVPVGSFLSGGIDSTIVVALAKEFNKNIETFSVGFSREGYSEIDVAQETAEKLGVNNTSYVITPEEFMEELPKIVWYFDEPLADPAAIPLYFVSREARRKVKVALSGEGADELFAGYTIYNEPNSLAMFDKIPKVGHKLLRAVSNIMPEGMKGKSFLMRGTTPLEERFVGNAFIFNEKEKKILLPKYREDAPYTTITAPLYKASEHLDPIQRMQYVDMHTWLRGDLLLNNDRMSMANSLEVRVPFLDVNVYDVAKRIPSSMTIANGTTKSILRKASESFIPEHVLNRKKLGFPVPIRLWLKDEMKEWATAIIKESPTEHLINKQYVLQMMEDHCADKRDNSRKIWTVLIFMIWHQVFVEKKYDFQTEGAKINFKPESK